MSNAFETSALKGDDYIRWLDGLWLERLLGACDPKPELTIGILLWPTFPMMSLTGILESLRHAANFGDNSRPVHRRWSIMAERGYKASASCGLRVPADLPYINPTDFDDAVVKRGATPASSRRTGAPPRLSKGSSRRWRSPDRRLYLCPHTRTRRLARRLQGRCPPVPPRGFPKGR
ncbi:Helix-turn-helix, AraC type:ThiJ/PfpI [Rhizobium rhizogenes K84]|uniref:Helix-turn-helix, AraC type:ThiJ/PfpI n=1 Tax=Rhizobium rhizogenes (strain K84 / ATCC BAA-868) TaxID=311403 RepID=B9JM26_RHIR8|nr:Helix-turn-helix, AraC type:ThiJ/PfpI [Rhizobium rhizogenes K84]